jgi:hypothetical protein
MGEPVKALVARRLPSVILLALIAAVGACTPPPDTRVAATLRDGEVVILAYVCEGYQVSIVQVYEIDGQGGTWDVAPPVDQTEYASSDHTIVIRPFKVPEGWDTLDDSLTRMVPATRYEVAFGSVQGQDPVVAFTLEQLQQLGDNQVWAGRTGSERAMSEDEFQRRAARDCP